MKLMRGALLSALLLGIVCHQAISEDEPKQPDPKAVPAATKPYAPQLGRGTFRVLQNGIVTAWVWRRSDLAPNTGRVEYWVFRTDPSPTMQPFTTFVVPDETNRDVSLQVMFVPSAQDGILDHNDYAAFLAWIMASGETGGTAINPNEIGARILHNGAPIPQ